MPLFAQGLVGDTAAPGGNFDTSGVNTDNNIATPSRAMPLAGRLRTLSVHFGGNGVSVAAILAGWDTALNPVARSAQFTAPAVPALQVRDTDGSCPVRGKSDTYQVGFWRDPAVSGKWFVTAAGSFEHKTLDPLGSMSGEIACAGPYICGNIQAYGLVVGVQPARDYHLPAVAMWKQRRGL